MLCMSLVSYNILALSAKRKRLLFLELEDCLLPRSIENFCAKRKRLLL